MKNLYKILKVWENLEAGFLENNKFDNRLDYLHAIVGYDANKNTTRIDYLKNIMSKEIQSYTQEELDRYSVINTKLDAINNFIQTCQITEIKDLDHLEMQSVVTAEDKVNRIRKLPENFFKNLLPIPVNTNHQVIKSNESFFQDIYGTTNSFGDTFYVDKCDDYKVKKLFMNLDYEESFILNNKFDLTLLKDKIRQEETRFNKAVYNACFCLSENDKLVYNLVFLDKKIIKSQKTESGKVEHKAIISGIEHPIKITKRNIIKYKEDTFFDVNLETVYDKIRIIFV